MDQAVTFGIVGFGYIGKRHAEIIKGYANAKAVAVADINPVQEAEAEKRGIPFFHSLDAMLNSGIHMDVINICTPNSLHAPQAIEALDKGYHVVIEKPMGLKRANCEQVIFKAFERSKRVFCVMQNRYSPPSEWLKSVIDQKLLGNIYTVQVNCYWNRDDRYYKAGSWKGSLEVDGGPLFTQFSHFTDIMYWLFGDITDIQAKFSNFNHLHSTEFEDSGHINFRFLNGGTGTFNYSTATWGKNFESSITILGEKGTIKVGGQYMDQVEYCHIDGYEMPELAPSNPPNDYGVYKGSAANHHYIIENVMDTFSGKIKYYDQCT